MEKSLLRRASAHFIAIYIIIRVMSLVTQLQNPVPLSSWKIFESEKGNCKLKHITAGFDFQLDLICSWIWFPARFLFQLDSISSWIWFPARFHFQLDLIPSWKRECRRAEQSTNTILSRYKSVQRFSQHQLFTLTMVWSPTFWDQY